MHKSSWSCDDNMRDSCELLGLLHHIDSSDYHTYSEIEVVASKYLELLHYLECQFPRRSQHQSKYSVWIISQLLKNRQCKASSLSAASLRTAYYILAVECLRQCLTLNPCWLRYTDALKVLLQPVIDLELLETIDSLFAFHY